MSTKPKDKFLFDFFYAGYKNPNSQKMKNHFTKTFVEPCEFNKLTKQITPEPGIKKVILIDGHPRSGKTWTVAAAVADVVDKDPSIKWWCSGIDSRKIFPDLQGNIIDGCSSVLTCLREDRYSIVLLDDFLGANIPRKISDNNSIVEMIPFFTWDITNPWLAAMAETSILIITGRSLFFTIDELLLDIKIRKNETNGSIRSTYNRSGLFRAFATNNLFGSFNTSQYARLYANQMKFHPLKNKRSLLFMHTPMLAYKDLDIQSKEGSFAAYAIFGEDLESLTEQIKLCEKQKDANQDGMLNMLDTAYAVCIAPGILFLGQNAYESLGVAERVGRVLDDLYLYKSTKVFRSGRVPNELYMKAVQDHLDKYLSIAARVFRRLQTNSKADNFVKKLALRGLVERGIYHLTHEPLQKLVENEPWWKAEIVKFQKESFDPLLHFEIVGGGIEYTEENALERFTGKLTPGLSGALGWSFYQFFTTSDHKPICQTVRSWLKSKFIELLNAFEKNNNKPKDLNLNNEEQYQILQNVIAIYSTLLQWVIKMPPDSDKEEFLDSLECFKINYLQHVASDSWAGLLLDKIIPYDEFFWGILEGNCNAVPINAAKSLNMLFENKDVFVGENKSTKFVAANQLFSLLWHNRWREFLEDKKYGVAREYMKKAEEWHRAVCSDGLEFIKDNPSVLYANLQYHWCHFITQYSQWMRDWCFQKAPHEFEQERSQIARGSSNPEHNKEFEEIAVSFFSNPDIPMFQIRNLLLFVGTRASRLSEKTQEEILKAINGRIRTKDGQLSEEGSFVIQAIFELARQGFLEKTSDLTPLKFCNWYKEITEESKPICAVAWDAYYGQIEALTCNLDLRPNSWEDIKPEDWKSLKD